MVTWRGCGDVIDGLLLSKGKVKNRKAPGKYPHSNLVDLLWLFPKKTGERSSRSVSPQNGLDPALETAVPCQEGPPGLPSMGQPPSQRGCKGSPVKRLIDNGLECKCEVCIETKYTRDLDDPGLSTALRAGQQTGIPKELPLNLPVHR